MPETSPTIGAQIRDLLSGPLYELGPQARALQLLPLFRERIADAARRNSDYARYVESWPTPIDQATCLADLPYLPVSVFKSREPLSLLPPDAPRRIVASSGTSDQIPSRIVVDTATAKAMSIGAISIFRDFIGSQRRPYLVIDAPQTNQRNVPLSARGAAIRGLMPLATECQAVMRDPERLDLDVDLLTEWVEQYRGQPVLIYGFTYILWFHFARVLREQGICLNLPDAHVLHSGGWKRLIADAVDKTTFNNTIAKVLGCPPANVVDFYGMVENIGVVYPDCPQGNKHVPSFADVICRSPRTLEPVAEGEAGIIQVGSLLPESFPGHLLLTEDLGTVETYDGCACGRRGLAFRLTGRIPRAELRGCGDVIARRMAA